MTQTEEIEEGIYKITTQNYIPFYVLMTGGTISIVQPILKDNEEFNKDIYFGTKSPKELVFEIGEFNDFITALNKIIVMERLD